MVKVEFDLPSNLHEAVSLISDTFKVSVEEILVEALRHDLQGDVSDNLNSYSEVVAKQIEELLKEQTDPCEKCVVKPGSEECEGCPKNLA